MRTSGLCFLFALPLSLAAPALEDLAGNTENGLAAGSPCKGHTVIFGRGTFEIGNVGSITGPPFFEALSKLVNSDLAVQGVDYPANIRGFLAGGDTDGSAKMAQLVEQALTTCPYTKISLSGYSQGAQLVHKAAALLPADLAAKISSVITFGDPKNGQPITGVSAARTKVFCNQDDQICAGGILITQAHLSYAEHAQEAAEFAVSVAENQ